MKDVWIKDIKDKVGETVELFGWVNVRRDHGKIIFIDLRDRSGIAQLVFTPQNEELYKIAETLRPEWVISVKGEVAKRPKGMENPEIETGKVEVKVSELKILSEAKQPIPIQVAEKTESEPDLDTRMDWRWLDLRKSEKQLIFKVWTVMEQAFRDFLIQNNFIEIHSPKLMSSPSESGAELFEVKYFKKKAYLAQSPQFYKQMAMAAGFERVFEIGPVFRANPSFTSRHDTEFTSYDLEMSFIDSHQDIINLEQQLIVSMLSSVKEKFGNEINKYYDRNLIIPEIPFPQVTLEEVKELLSGFKISGIEEGDLNPEEERKLCEVIKNKLNHEFVFVTDYPKEKRAFYHMRYKEKTGITKGFDLLWSGLEITTGAQREHRYELLKKQAKEKGLSMKSFQYYLDFFKYGCPPHGGFGFGPSRFLMKILNVSNVREVTYLYRGVKRLSP